MVMPGIHDGHMHPLSGGRTLTAPSLNYEQLTCPDAGPHRGFLEDTVRGGARRVARASGVGRDRDGPAPRPADLDVLDTARPIFVRSLDGHIALVNSRALEIASMTAARRTRRDGEIVRDASGDATGLLEDVGDRAGRRAEIPEPTVAQNAASLKAAIREDGEAGHHDLPGRVGRSDQLAALAAICATPAS